MSEATSARNGRNIAQKLSNREGLVQKSDPNLLAWLQNMQMPFLMRSEEQKRYFVRALQPIQVNSKDIENVNFDEVKCMAALLECGMRFKSPMHAIAMQEFAESCNMSYRKDSHIVMAKARNLARQHYSEELRLQTSNLHLTMLEAVHMKQQAGMQGACEFEGVLSNVVMVSYEITNTAWHQMLLSDGVCHVWVWVSAFLAESVFDFKVGDERKRNVGAICTQHNHATCLPLLCLGKLVTVLCECSTVQFGTHTRTIIYARRVKMASSLANYDVTSAWSRCDIGDNAITRHFYGGYDVPLEVKEPTQRNASPSEWTFKCKLANSVIGQGSPPRVLTTPTQQEAKQTTAINKVPEQWHLMLNSWSTLTEKSCTDLDYVNDFHGLVRLEGLPSPYKCVYKWLQVEVSDGHTSSRLLLTDSVLDDAISSFRNLLPQDIRIRLNELTQDADSTFKAWEMATNAKIGKQPIMCIRSSATPPEGQRHLYNKGAFAHAAWISKITYAANMTLFLSDAVTANDGSAAELELDEHEDEHLHFICSYSTFVFLRACYFLRPTYAEWAKLLYRDKEKLLTRTKPSLQALPSDISHKILQLLPYEAWRRLGSTCLKFKQMLCSSEYEEHVFDGSVMLECMPLYHKNAITRLLRSATVFTLAFDIPHSSSVASIYMWNGLNLNFGNRSEGRVTYPFDNATFQLFDSHDAPPGRTRKGYKMPLFDHARDLAEMMTSCSLSLDGNSDELVYQFSEITEREAAMEIDHSAMEPRSLNFDDVADDNEMPELFDDTVDSSDADEDAEDESLSEDEMLEVEEDNAESATLSYNPSLPVSQEQLDTSVHEEESVTLQSSSLTFMKSRVFAAGQEDVAISNIKCDGSSDDHEPDLDLLIERAKNNTKTAQMQYNNALVGKARQDNLVLAYYNLMHAWSRLDHLETCKRQGHVTPFTDSQKIHRTLRVLQPLTTFHNRVFAEMCMEHIRQTTINAFKWCDLKDRTLYDVVVEINMHYNIGPPPATKPDCLCLNLFRFQQQPACSLDDFIDRVYGADAWSWFSDNWATTVNMIAGVGDVFNLWGSPLLFHDDGVKNLRWNEDKRNAWSLRVQVLDVRCGHSMYGKVMSRHEQPDEAWDLKKSRAVFYCNGQNPKGGDLSVADIDESVTLTLRDGDMDMMVNVSFCELAHILAHLENQASLYINGCMDMVCRKSMIVSKLVGAVISIDVLRPSPILLPLDDNTPPHLTALFACSHTHTDSSSTICVFPLFGTNVHVLNSGWRNGHSFRIPHDAIKFSTRWESEHCWSDAVHGHHKGSNPNEMSIICKTGPAKRHVFHYGHGEFPACS